MTHLLSLDQIDVRARLPRASWSIGTRSGAPTAITLHYNGPPVGGANQSGDGLIAQLISDARYQMRPGGLGAVNGGDGLQYHYAIGAGGTIYQCRDERAELWHCADPDGNAHSLSVHLPLGGAQDATEAQWQAFTALTSDRMAVYHIARARVLGHCEWPQARTPCPGPNLLRRLRAWRNQEVINPARHGGTASILMSVAQANVRQGPGVTFPVAAVMYPGDTLIYDAITLGAKVGGDARWAHRADGVGFVHASLVEGL